MNTAPSIGCNHRWYPSADRWNRNHEWVVRSEAPYWTHSRGIIINKVTHSSDQRVIWQDGNFYAAAARSIILPHKNLSGITKLNIHIHTPLRIRRDGALLETVDFPTIVRNITQRIKAIVTRYGGWVDSMEIELIQELSPKVIVIQNDLKLKNLKRYSNKLGEKMDFSGLLGTIQFEGDLTPFVPWMYAAEILHVGRNTTFGMGRIEVEFA